MARMYPLTTMNAANSPPATAPLIAREVRKLEVDAEVASVLVLLFDQYFARPVVPSIIAWTPRNE